MTTERLCWHVSKKSTYPTPCPPTRHHAWARSLDEQTFSTLCRVG
jgi:hypothetical protein